MAYVHSLGQAGGTVLDFTDWPKWMISAPLNIDIHQTEEYSSGGGSPRLTFHSDDGETRGLPVTIFGGMEAIRDAETEINAMLNLARATGIPNSGLDPVDYSEQLGDEMLPKVWECIGGVWRPGDYSLIGGGAMEGVLILRLKID